MVYCLTLVTNVYIGLPEKKKNSFVAREETGIHGVTDRHITGEPVVLLRKSQYPAGLLVMDESGNNRNSKEGKFNTKKLNLGNLRCSKGSFSDSPRRLSSSKNQSQATISSFFSSKTCVQSAVKVYATKRAKLPSFSENRFTL